MLSKEANKEKCPAGQREQLSARNKPKSIVTIYENRRNHQINATQWRGEISSTASCETKEARTAAWYYS